MHLAVQARLPDADSELSETRHKTLEEIAAAFGDKVVTLTETELSAEQTVFDEKAGIGHVEEREASGEKV